MILPAQRALEKITKGKIAPGYLLLGNELYWRDRIWAALRDGLALSSGSTGITELDLRQASLDSILGQAAERNLWSPRQLILVRSAQSLSGAKPLESVAEYFAHPNPDATLVFEMTDMDLESEDWRDREKSKSRQEHWEPLCDVVLLQPLGMAESMEVVRGEAAARGARITPDAAETLASLLDRDLGRIVKELDKLVSYVGEGQQITETAVAELTSSQPVSSGLSLPEAIGTGDPAKVIESFDAMVPPGSYLPLVVAELTRYLRQLMLLQQSRPRDAREAARVLWSARLPAPQPLMAELLRQARALSSKHLARCLGAALRAEVALRSSPADDRLIVERFLLEIARPLRGKGSSRPAPVTASPRR
jgi:DNA polymerase III subunit delta